MLLVSCFLAGWLALPAMALPPESLLLAQNDDAIEQLQEQQKQIEQQRSNLSKERDRLEQQEDSARNRLTGLQQNIKVTTVQIKDNEYRLKLAKQKLKDLQTDLAVAERKYQQRQAATGARLRFLQRQQGSRGWAVLLQSQNLNEFLDRRRQLRLVYQADRQSLDALIAESKDLYEQKLQVERQKNAIALLTQQLLAQKAQYEGQAQAEQDLVERLRQDQTALEAAEAQLAADSASLGELIQKRVAEQRAREAADRGIVVVRGTGQMSFPSDGPITSVFGWRVHPILGYERFHSGVDFGADYGSIIRAADAGVVIFSGWYGGYGYAVVIDHGNGITTLYGHSSELYVGEGDAVQRGQAIAAVGSTGLSTGPHLHFEVRQDGEPVDPMAYL